MFSFEEILKSAVLVYNRKQLTNSLAFFGVGYVLKDHCILTIFSNSDDDVLKVGTRLRIFLSQPLYV